MDRTLYDTKFGKKVQHIFGIESIDSTKVDEIKDYKGIKARAYQFSMGKGNTLGENVTSTVKQTASSAVNATSTLAGIGYGGAIGAKYGGAAGSLIGMVVGAVLGSKASGKLQEIIA